MDYADKPDDFLFEEVPLSPAQAQTHSVRTRATQITKAALQDYLKQYFDVDGIYREQIAGLAPYVVQYETGISGTAAQNDPTRHEMQIARYWGGLKQKLPCIILVDQGFRQNSVGLGGIVQNVSLGKHIGLGLRVDVTIPLMLEVAAGDETTAADLRDVLSLIFGTLTHFNRAHIIQPGTPSTSWEVRLPLRYEAAGIERRAVNNDNGLDNYWAASITLDVDFEGIAVLARENPAHVFENELSTEVTYDPCFQPAAEPSIASIRVPDTLYLNQPRRINAQYVPFKARFVSDNPNMLHVFDLEMVPRRMGECNVLLIGENGDTLESYPVSIVV